MVVPAAALKIIPCISRVPFGALSAYLHRAVTASGSAMAVSATTLRVQEFDKGRGPVGLPPIG